MVTVNSPVSLSTVAVNGALVTEHLTGEARAESWETYDVRNTFTSPVLTVNGSVVLLYTSTVLAALVVEESLRIALSMVPVFPLAS